MDLASHACTFMVHNTNHLFQRQLQTMQSVQKQMFTFIDD